MGPLQALEDRLRRETLAARDTGHPQGVYPIFPQWNDFHWRCHAGFIEEGGGAGEQDREKGNKVRDGEV